MGRIFKRKCFGSLSCTGKRAGTPEIWVEVAQSSRRKRSRGRWTTEQGGPFSAASVCLFEPVRDRAVSKLSI